MINFECLYQHQPFMDHLWENGFTLEELALNRLVCKTWRLQIDSNDLWKKIAKKIGIPHTHRSLGIGTHQLVETGIWRTEVYRHIRYCSRRVSQKKQYPTVREVALWTQRLELFSGISFFSNENYNRSSPLFRLFSENTSRQPRYYIDSNDTIDAELEQEYASYLAIVQREKPIVSSLRINRLPSSFPLSCFMQSENLSKLEIQFCNLLEVPDLSCFTNLKEIYLRSNLISTLPSNITTLVSLEKLNCSQNRIKHTEIDLTSLTRLCCIDLSHNSISALEFSYLPTSLTRLDLSWNPLAQIGGSIGLLTQLHTLLLRNCKLTHISAAGLSNLRKLRELNVQNNELMEIPYGISDLTHLREFNFQHNPIEFIRDESVVFKQRRVYLVGLKLQSLPDWLCQYTKIQGLYLDQNLLTDLPDRLSSLQKLETLSLVSNRFERFPRVILKLRCLRVLTLENNPNIRIPESITKLTKIRHLSFGEFPI